MDDITVKAVKCLTCGTLHDSEEDTFISVHGNICIGMGGGVVGNNLDSLGAVKNISIFCRSKRCLDSLMKKLEPKPVMRG